ncbi:MAG: hypothetical protein HYV59_03995 [Planctomycetes bacterium]|nr:hypothetical protein [Planctomycetota bacterium]
MKYYKISAKLLSPIMIQENRQSNTPKSLSHIPGSTLRGALAMKHLRLGGSPKDDSFKDLFSFGSINYPNLYPADEQESNVSAILPFTALSCKNNSGFKRTNYEDQVGHGVNDDLADKLAKRLLGKYVSAHFCKKCRQDLRVFPGFWNRSINNPAKVDTVLLFARHTGIDRHTGTVASNIFFTNQVIADLQKVSIKTNQGKNKEFYTQHFNGCTYLSEEQLSLLQNLSSDSLFIGRNKSRGLGEVKLSIQETEETSFDLPKWDVSFKQKYQAITKSNLPEGIYFSINLESHAILLDKFLRPMYDFNPDFPEISPVLKIIKMQKIKGWNNAWKLAKSDDIAISMGSVFLFKYVGSDVSGLTVYLKKLNKSGIGLRIDEGFGQISVCNSFHTEMEDL